MKILRFISVIIIFLLSVLLVLGNIFHKNLRRYLDKYYLSIEITDEMIHSFEKLKKGNADFLLYVSTDKKVYRNLEKIFIFARLERKANFEVVENARLKAFLYDKNGKIIKNIDENEGILLLYDKKNKLWKGNFFPLNTELDGEIKIEIRAYPDTPEATVSAFYSVFIDNKSAFSQLLPKGLSLIGISSIERISKRIILSPNGREVDWSYIPEWVNLLSADGILMNVGLTTSFQEEITINSPWSRDKLNESDTLAERLSQRGMYFAGYIKALKIEGAYLDKIGYSSTFNLTSDGFTEGEYVSLLDENRKASLIKLFSALMQNKNYSYVGLSDLYLLNGEGIELCEVFYRDMQLDFSEYKELDFTNKIKLFSEKLKNKDFLVVFERWKQYFIAGYIRELIETSGHNKPVFYYVEYESLKKDTSLLNVLVSSGVDFFVINFNIPYFDLLKEINELKNSPIASFADRILFSYEIDYKKNLEFENLNLCGIETYFNLYLTAIKEISKRFNLKGIVVNDLYNAMSGKRGPYSPLEWMFGIGKIIYNFKSINSKMALDIDYYFPLDIEYEKEFNIILKLRNLTDKTVKNIRIEFLDDNGNTIDKVNLLSELKIGEIKEVKTPFLIRQKNATMVKGSQLIGIRLSWDEKGEKDTFSKNFIFFENFNVITSSTN